MYELKSGWWIVTGLIIGLGVFVLILTHEKQNAFKTPEMALNQVQNPSIKVGKMIDVQTIKNYNLAFIFFYSTEQNPNDSIGVATIHKAWYGWKFVKMNRAGVLSDQNLNALKTGIPLTDVGLKNSYYWVGLTNQDVANVKVGDRNATMIPLKNSQDLSIFAFLSRPTTNEKVITFINQQGEGFLNQTY